MRRSYCATRRHKHPSSKLGHRSSVARIDLTRVDAAPGAWVEGSRQLTTPPAMRHQLTAATSLIYPEHNNVPIICVSIPLWLITAPRNGINMHIVFAGAAPIGARGA